MKIFREDTLDDAPEDCVVYAIYLTHDPSKGYIGSTTNFRRRMKQHLSKLEKRKHGNYKLNRLFPRYRRNFRFMILETCESGSDARSREQTQIDFADPKKLYNIDLEVRKHRSD